MSSRWPPACTYLIICRASNFITVRVLYAFYEVYMLTNYQKHFRTRHDTVFEHSKRPTCVCSQEKNESRLSKYIFTTIFQQQNLYNIDYTTGLSG